MTAALILAGAYLVLSAAVACLLGRAMREQPAPPPQWEVPDDLAGLWRELEVNR